MPNTYACKLVSNPNVPIFLPRVCTLVLFIRIQLYSSINILSKYSSLISHRLSIFEGRHIDYRSSKVDTSITDLRRSTHRSSVFEGQHIHLRRSTHRSSNVDTSISEGRHIVTSIFEGRHTIFEGRHIDL